jgi:hypothetical protein
MIHVIFRGDREELDWLVREVDHSSASSAEVKNIFYYTYGHLYILGTGALSRAYS